MPWERSTCQTAYPTALPPRGGLTGSSEVGFPTVTPVCEIRPSIASTGVLSSTAGSALRLAVSQRHGWVDPKRAAGWSNQGEKSDHDDQSGAGWDETWDTPPADLSSLH